MHLEQNPVCKHSLGLALAQRCGFCLDLAKPTIAFSGDPAIDFWLCPQLWPQAGFAVTELALSWPVDDDAIYL